jgi:hypothetical protein
MELCVSFSSIILLGGFQRLITFQTIIIIARTPYEFIRTKEVRALKRLLLRAACRDPAALRGADYAEQGRTMYLLFLLQCCQASAALKTSVISGQGGASACRCKCCIMR